MKAENADLVARLAAAEGELQANAGAFRQVQHEVDELRGRYEGEPGEDVGDGAAGPGDGGEDVAYAGTGRSPPTAAPAAGAAFPPPVVYNEVRKANLSMWRSPPSQRMWYLTGQRPQFSTMPLADLSVVLRRKTKVSKDVAEMLNTFANFKVRSFVPAGEEVPAGSIRLVEHLEICIDAIIAVLRRQCSQAGAARRVDTLEAAFRGGMTRFKEHCNDFRSKLGVPGNVDIMAYWVDMSLNDWADALNQQAAAFGHIHETGAPPADHFPAVLTPSWKSLDGWMSKGGLQYLPSPPPRTNAPAASSSSGAKKGATGRGGRKGICWAFNSKGGCSRSARDCMWSHEEDPRKRKNRRAPHAGGGVGSGGSSGGGGGGGSGGGCVTHN